MYFYCDRKDNHVVSQYRVVYLILRLLLVVVCNSLYPHCSAIALAIPLKVIAYSSSPQFERAVGKSLSSLSEFRIEGVDTNIGFLKNVLSHPDFMDGSVHTRWVDENLKTLAVVDELDGDRR